MISQDEVNLNFNWGMGSPASGVPVDNFSLICQRYEYFYAGNYRFYATVDDGVRVYVDNTLIIDAWRVDYNTVRPHRSLGQQTPAAFAAAACAGPKPGCGACSAAALATTEPRMNADGLTLSV